MIALVAWGAPIAVIGFVPVTLVAILALGTVGVANALLDVSGLTLLQRGTSNAARSAVFAVLEVAASAGVSIGGVLASLLIEVLGIERSLVLVGLSLPVVAVVGWPLVRRLDTEGVMPERQASLLRGLPLFAALPLAALERVATGMHEVRFAPGERTDDPGRRGRHVRRDRARATSRWRWTAGRTTGRAPAPGSARSPCCARSRGRRRSRRWPTSTPGPSTARRSSRRSPGTRAARRPRTRWSSRGSTRGPAPRTAR